MNIQHLKYAVEVERVGSISQAADNLYMNQPNLSKAIKELEASIGIILFHRSSRGVVATKDGIRFLTQAKRILEQVENLEATYQPKNNKQFFRVSVPRGSYITSAFVEFIKGFDPLKDIEINFCETTSTGAIRNIVENGYSIGIIRCKSTEEEEHLSLLRDRDLCHELLWDFEYFVLLNQKNRLARNESINYADLNDYTELVHDDLDIPQRYPMDRRWMRQEALREKHIRVYERETQLAMLSSIEDTFMWVSPMASKFLSRTDFTQKSCNLPGNQYKDFLIYPSGYQFSELDRSFIKVIKETISQIKNELKSK